MKPGNMTHVTLSVRYSTMISLSTSTGVSPLKQAVSYEENERIWKKSEIVKKINSCERIERWNLCSR